MRFLASDLPIVQEALNVYVAALKRSIEAHMTTQGASVPEVALDAIENAERLLARARVELAKQRAEEASPLAQGSPTPGVSL